MINFTPEDLLLYSYNELSAERKEAIEKALETDWALSEKHKVMQTAMMRLDTIIVSPRTEVILNILRYAKENTEETV